VAQFAVQLAVGALAGATGLGFLQLASSWTSIGGEVCGRGLPTYAMKQLSSDPGNTQQREAFLRTARRAILVGWLKLSPVIVTLIAICLFVIDEPGYGYLIASVAVTAPLFSVLRLRAEALKALGAPLAAVSLENLTTPVVILILCILCWSAGWVLEAAALILANMLGILVAMTMLKRRLSAASAQQSKSDTTAASPTGFNALQQRHLWIVGLLSILFVQSPFVLMPLFVSTQEIGVFSLAFKFINIITTLLILFAAIYGPRFARLGATRDAKGLAATLRQTQLACLALFVPAAGCCILLAEPLAALFGKEFAQLGTFLMILSAGHLINAATGLCGVVLNMAGAEKKEILALSCALAVATLAAMIVGPLFGAIGLAWVFTASIVIKNLLSYCFARQLINQLEQTL
jgi:O-antigen/teichoic acid export membrane protein